MNMVKDKLLLMTGTDTRAAVIDSIKDFFDLEILEAETEKKAFELIYTHFFVLVMVDETLPHIDMYKIGAMLMSHRQTYNAPLLIITDAIAPKQFLSDFKSLRIDYMIKPFDGQLMRAKINIFYDLFEQKKAVDQSLNELDKIYKKMASQYDLAASPVKSKHIRLQKDHASDPLNGYHILYVEDSNEDFNIFSHFIRGVINCSVSQAKTLEEAVGLISEKRIDMIFINYILPDGNGFDLLSKLNQMRSDIPVIFTLEKHTLHKGPEAIAKGAFTYFAKEGLSAENIFSVIHSTLKKAGIAREAEDARNRIIMISKKDFLTKLYNRQCFEQELESEISTAKRYQTPLSVLIVDFDHFKKTVNIVHGYETGDAILTTSAALIQSMVRTNDRVCRYGGEEFGIVLPNTALNGARLLAERIKEKIAGFRFETGTTVLRLTVSIGIAAYDHKSGSAVHDLAKNALHALTSAMDQGGNKIKIFIPKP